ncbi:MAG: dephospho-CoA kinase [Desulfatitalea sp.]|nr:dephospho-CoA kinase [Desulfatitalea sp.]NNK02262.1 dephospho-CoA kinase [Desulfatitalea sp.]
MILAGLTGGIASGKSTVSGFLHAAGAVIIDADQISRQVTERGKPAWQSIRRLFGDTVLFPDGTLDRAKLGRIVFSDATLRRGLEQIIHPCVQAEMDTQLTHVAQNAPEAVVILDIPLLFETGRTEGMAETILVDVPEDVQCHRLMQRDGYSRQEARKRMASQMPLAEKRKHATIIIDNSGDLSDTKAQALRVFHLLARKAGQSKISVSCGDDTPKK